MEEERRNIENSLMDRLGVDRPVVGGPFDHARKGGRKVLGRGIGRPWVYLQNDKGYLDLVSGLD